MISCEWMADRMPAVAHGRAEWTGEEAAHLMTCPACAADWRLIAAARRVGDSATRRLQPEAVSRSVLRRLAEARRHRLRRRLGVIGSLAAAALVTLVLWSGRYGRGSAGESGAGTAVPVLQLPLAELESLNEGQLTTVLEGLEAPLGAEATMETPALGDLQDSELERVLRSLEG
jgi:anti-sigma factor RsiW